MISNEQPKESKPHQMPRKNFKVLKHNENLLAWLGVVPYQSEHNIDLFKSPATHFILFNIIILIIGSSAIYIYNNPFAFKQVLQVCNVILSGCQVGGMFISTAIKSTNINVLHRKLQQIIDKGD